MALEFLKTYSSENTVNAYRLAIKSFLQSTYNIEIHNGDLEITASKYLAENRDRQKDLEDFLISLKGRPPKTVKMFLAAIKTFLLENKIELPQLFWRKLQGRIRGSRALTLDKVPSNLELRKIFQHLPIQGRSLFLLLSSSGMRIGEALKLEPKDIDFKQDPPKINIRGEYTKTGNSRIAFFSTEAKEALEEWLKVREEYLKAAVAKSQRHKKDSVDSRLFPFEEDTAYSFWSNALRKSGLLELDASTQRKTIHPHVLRKYFRTKMGSIIPIDVTEALMGHEGYLTEAYRRYSVEDLASFYKKGEGAILVFANGQEVSKLRVEVEEKNKQLQTIINGLASENMELKERVKELNAKLGKVEDSLKEVGELKDLVKKALEKTST